MSAALRSCWMIRPVLSIPRSSVRAEVFDRSAEISVVIPDVTGCTPLRRGSLVVRPIMDQLCSYRERTGNWLNVSAGPQPGRRRQPAEHSATLPPAPGVQVGPARMDQPDAWLPPAPT